MHHVQTLCEGYVGVVVTQGKGWTLIKFWIIVLRPTSPSNCGTYEKREKEKEREYELLKARHLKQRKKCITNFSSSIHFKMIVMWHWFSCGLRWRQLHSKTMLAFQRRTKGVARKSQKWRCSNEVPMKVVGGIWWWWGRLVGNAKLEGMALNGSGVRAPRTHVP